ncbi:hypothetical protein G4D82_12250 [Flavobacterium sp. CYK-4]|uniref:hypothetical protein n=1 Tax=Flavobacterium lotistagni TaxID=2709660 RepID=UPI00140D5E41|nr:hypothetical protein [Flavobacterium lotistagni]NHM07997.1 hypothetical protein [Flavobacterium lotistagni]
MKPEENALRLRILKLEEEAKVMKRLSTRQGFFDMYYEALPDHSTYESAFNSVNDLHFQLFGFYRYSDYVSFKNVINYYKRKK